MSCTRFPDCLGARTELGEVLSNDPAKPIGTHPETGENIYVLSGRFGPYVQLGEMPEKRKQPRRPKGVGAPTKASGSSKPKRASIPKEKDPSAVTLADAVHYLSLPRVLGNHPETGEPISANTGRFGPYIVHQKDFRSLKTDDVYKITLERALEILKEEKKKRGFARKTKTA